MRKYYGFRDHIRDQFFPNRAFDPVALYEWLKTEAELRAKLWSGLHRVHWYCPELFVHPAHHKAGFALLLKWGLGRGGIDGISCFAGCQLNQVERYEAEGMERILQFQCGPSKGLIVFAKIEPFAQSFTNTNLYFF